MGRFVDTPSAAVMLGLKRTRPPVDEKLPAVSAEPSAEKKMRRGPSELNVSTRSAPVNDVVHGPEGAVIMNAAHAGVAATPKVLAAVTAACPRISPPVPIESVPRL